MRAPPSERLASLPAVTVRPMLLTGTRAFGAVLEAAPEMPPPSRADLLRADVGEELRELWLDRGVLAVRGLVDLTPEDLASISEHFGPLVKELATGRDHTRLPGVPVMRLGNTKGPDGRPNCIAAGDSWDSLAGGSPQYRPEDQRPLWHTDATFRAEPPAGSALFCRQAPPEGGATCFADMRAAFQALPAEEQRELEGMECICSLSHHDWKLWRRHGDALAPRPTAALRAANPARRVPLVMRHPVTGGKALYGMNLSTCCIVPRGEAVDEERLARLESSPEEDASMAVWRELLPRVTGPDLALVWHWRAGDLVVWDNRSTMHAATGFDHERYVREMWRTTMQAGEAASEAPGASKRPRRDRHPPHSPPVSAPP